MNEKTAINIDELLQRFVSTDDLRPRFMKPWRERDKVFASENHILIRVNGNMTTANYPEYNSDNTNKLIPTGASDGILSAAILENAISYAPLVDEKERVIDDVECKECDGTGEVEWDYKCWSKMFECPCCYGTGHIETSRKKATDRKVIDPNAVIKIGPKYFWAGFLKQILDAMEYCGCKEATVTFGDRIRATRFNLTDEIDIILMPTSSNAAYKTISLKKVC
ncbi:MAG: hypothetical protein HDR46_01095 [Bacteroides sp.]|nr:hypothetical protein [Bacteroides sp.]